MPGITYVVAAAGLIAVATAGAQSHAMATTGVVTGTVTDGAKQPIEQVEVSVVNGSAAARTDTAGRFALTGLFPGSAALRFRRLGFEPVVLMAQVPSGDTTDVDVTLTVVAQQLKGVIVQEDAAKIMQLADFEDRRRRGFGHFITRAQIEARRPLLMSEMARQIPGTVLLPNRAGQSTLYFAGAPHQSCPPQYWVDGVMVTGFNIDDIVPSDVEGVEFYSGPAGLPPQYNRSRGNTICGVVLIWTRLPGD
ncbi:MAG TPA: carboxypeptidase regulatory-like domain-containing protein [Gemmatimonadaceae bacterium]|nr:carboxypeptidase regulatory-like domain-containing protein [Gemmatimonadaceae bacterium]